MHRSQAGRERIQMRHRIGVYFGYFGLFMGLMSFVATNSEGTPLPPGDSAWMVFGCMIVFYLVGWALAPLMNRRYGTKQP
ncbi:MAG: hypothetical protein L0177_16845 [Chloroflexi bacterium]|nr:hypothetical protein [Chloroflexota bacterium]